MKVRKLIINMICLYFIISYIENPFVHDMGFAVEEYKYAKSIDNKIEKLEDRVMKKKYEALNEKYEDIGENLESMDCEVKVLEALEKAYLASGVQLINQCHEVRDLKLQKSNGYIESTDIKMTISGDRENTVKFLNMIEEMGGFISIGSVDVLAEKDGGLLSCVEVKIYSDLD